MTRDELIERLAVAQRPRYPRMTPIEQKNYRSAVLRWEWPLIVEFVAEWIDNQAGDNLYSGCHFRIREMAHQWREEMQGETAGER